MIGSNAIRNFIDTLLHPSVRADALTSARHRAFIAPRLLFSLVALALLPLYLALRGAPTMIEVVAVVWLVAPILLAYFLSRTGRYESAHMLSSMALTGLVVAIATETGGMESFAAVWLVVVPLEAALSASRRVVGAATLLALGSALALIGFGAAGMLSAADTSELTRSALMALGVISATVYAAALAFGSERLTRTSFWLLYAEEDRYRLLARNMSDVVSRHRRNGAVEFISPAAEALLGVPARALHGHGLFDRVHVTDRPAYLTALADADQAGDVRCVEFRARRNMPSKGTATPSSELIWIEMRCRPLTDAAGMGEGEGGVVAVMRDITERKRQEEALDQARAQAEQADMSKSRFLATMSHELRTPLNAIIGFSEMIMQEEQLSLDAARRREYSSLIHDSGQHLLSVVNDILDMSKMESGNFEIEFEPFAPRGAIAACCDLMALKARDGGIDLVRRVPDDLPDMTGDQRALKQILINLVSNAIKFTERGGKVTVAAAVTGSKLVLSVTDTGVGVDADDLKRLGDAFFQAGKTYQRRHEGTGLGLSIVKGLVALHQGEMTIESRIGEGTSVSVALPLAPESRASVSVITPMPTRNVPPQYQVKKSA